MGQFVYQRPREKLSDRGAGALLNSELIQVVISSGSQGISVAKIAKNISALLNRTHHPMLEDLVAIPGVGGAKAAQILAAIELGKRYNAEPSKVSPYDFQILKVSKKPTVEYVALDGGGDIVQSWSALCADALQSNLLVKKMFAHALGVHAASMIIGIGHCAQAIDTLDEDMLAIFKMIFDTASVVDIKVEAIWLVNQATSRSFQRKALR